MKIGTRAWRLILLGVLARAPAAAIGLLLILRVEEISQSYGWGGLAAAVFALGIAAGMPLLGRLSDAHGQGVIGLAGATVSASSLTAIAVVSEPAVVTPLAMVAGLGYPPLNASTRALLRNMMLEPERRQVAFGVDAAMQEVAFILSPAVFVGAVGAVSTAAGLVACAATLALSASMFALRSDWRLLERRVERMSALGFPDLRALASMSVGVGASLASVELGLAVVVGSDNRFALGGLLAIFATSSLLFGLLTAMRPAAQPLRRLVLLYGLLAAFQPLFLITSDLLALAAVAAVAGSPVAAAFAIVSSRCANVLPQQVLTEAYAVLGASIYVGASLGSVVSGALVEPLGWRGPFLAGGVAALFVAGRSFVIYTRARRAGTDIQAVVRA